MSEAGCGLYQTRLAQETPDLAWEGLAGPRKDAPRRWLKANGVEGDGRISCWTPAVPCA